MTIHLNHVSGSATCRPRFYKKRTETANVEACKVCLGELTNSRGITYALVVNGGYLHIHRFVWIDRFMETARVQYDLNLSKLYVPLSISDLLFSLYRQYC